MIKKNAKLTHDALEAELVSVEDRGDEQIDPTAAATIAPNPEAVGIYSALGAADAAGPGADVDSGPETPQPPSAALVRSASRSPVDALGQRFGQFRTSYAEGTYGVVTPAEVSRMRVVVSLWPVIAVFFAVAFAGFLTEVVYGQHGAALLSGATPAQALLAAVAFMLVFNGAAFFGTHLAYEAYPGMVRRLGVRLLIGLLVVVVVVATGLGLVIGGYDPVSVQTITGGGAANSLTPEPDTRPLLTLTYVAIVVLITLAIAAGHLLLLHLIDVKLMMRTKAAIADAAERSLDWNSARSVAISVAQSYLEAIEAAHQQGRHRVGAWNAAFRRACTPEVNDMFDDIVYDDSEPAWAAQTQQFIEALEAQDAPPANLSRIA